MRRSFRHIVVLLIVLLLANTPVQAGPITIGDVVQIVGSYQNPPSLGLPSSQGRSLPGGSTQTIDSSVVTSNYDSVLSGIVEVHTTQDPVNIVVQGDVEGTVCDCGEVTVPGGLPKWPLAFLAAIPFFFIEDDDCDDCDKIVPTPTPTPNPTPPPTPTPEPASLLLFGSGLAALGEGLRRRRLKAKLKTEGASTEEG